MNAMVMSLFNRGTSKIIFDIDTKNGSVYTSTVK